MRPWFVANLVRDLFYYFSAKFIAQYNLAAKQFDILVMNLHNREDSVVLCSGVLLDWTRDYKSMLFSHTNYYENIIF